MRLSELQNYPETIPDESGPGAPALAVVTVTQSTSTTERSSGANFGRSPFRRTARSRPPYTIEIEIHPKGQFCSLAVSGFEATTVSEQVRDRALEIAFEEEDSDGPRRCLTMGLGRGCDPTKGLRWARPTGFATARSILAGTCRRARGLASGLEVAPRTLRTQPRRQCADTSVPHGPA
jgi:hypothetical protein